MVPGDRVYYRCLLDEWAYPLPAHNNLGSPKTSSSCEADSVPGKPDRGADCRLCRGSQSMYLVGRGECRPDAPPKQVLRMLWMWLTYLSKYLLMTVYVGSSQHSLPGVATCSVDWQVGKTTVDKVPNLETSER